MCVTMGVVDDNIGIVVLVLYEPDAFETALYFISSVFKFD
jgi:hypothetical protein